MSNSSDPYFQCTLSTCPISDAQVRYIPTLFGNAFYLSIFALLLILQIGQGIYYKTWTFLVAMVGGFVLEIIGYASRIQMHHNPFLSNPFLIYLITLTIAPTFLSAGIYLCLARIVVVYGEVHSRFKPRTYTITFIACDIFSLVLQSAGGALADLATTREQQDTGVHIMIAGLAFQVASLLVFAGLCLDFAWTVRKNKGIGLSIEGKTFGMFLYALAFATVFIFVRSCFRVSELSGGFGSELANDQITFMILEGAMIVSACLCLTVCHPGRAFAGGWQSAGYKFRNNGEKSEVSG